MKPVESIIEHASGKRFGGLFLNLLIEKLLGFRQMPVDPIRNALLTSARSAYDAGFLGRQMPDLSGMYDLTLLNQVLVEKGKKAIQ